MNNWPYYVTLWVVFAIVVFFMNFWFLQDCKGKTLRGRPKNKNSTRRV